MGLFKKLFGGADAINDYFADAVIVYLETDDGVARLAAVSAGKIAAGAQRVSMVNYLRTLAADGQAAGMTQGAYKLNQLADELALKDWSVAEAKQSKLALAKLDSEYAAALDAFDSTVFRRRNAHVFG